MRRCNWYHGMKSYNHQPYQWLNPSSGKMPILDPDMPSNPATETGELTHVRARQPKTHPMKLDGTITYGNIMVAASAALSVGIGWGILTSRQESTDKTVAAQSVEFKAAISDIKESQRDARLEAKELQRSVAAISTDTALIRGRLANGDGTARSGK